MTPPKKLALWQGFGMEFEYLLADRIGLEARAKARWFLQKMKTFSKHPKFEWSHEFFQHLVEVKNTDPTLSLEQLAKGVRQEVQAAAVFLKKKGFVFLPAGMHPFLDGKNSIPLWPGKIYRTYAKIFDCRRQGFLNVQSAHWNLSFADEKEFVALHRAARLILPLLPAAAAASPIARGKWTGFKDYRLVVYRKNQVEVPAVTGAVIPESIASFQEYREKIWRPIQNALQRKAPQDVLKAEWVNSRGAILRMDRSALEIRLVDLQECPAQDVALAAAGRAILRVLVEERWSSAGKQEVFPAHRLVRLLGAAEKDAEDAVFADGEYLRLFGLQRSSLTGAEVWRALVQRLRKENQLGTQWEKHWELLFRKGTLATRILKFLNGDFSKEKILAAWRRLAEALEAGEPWSGR